jgi:hypothetical protein
MRARLVLAAALVAALTCGLGAGSALGAGPAATAAKAKRCRGTEAYVGTRVRCLKPGTRCRRSLREDYRRAGFRCVRRRIHHRRRHVLRRLGPAALRQGRVIALGPSGRPTFRQALWNFDATVAPLPGVRTPKGAVGRETSGTGAIKSLDAYTKRLSRGQRRVLRRILRPRGRPVVLGAPVARTAKNPPLGDMQKIVEDAVTRLNGHGITFKHQVALYTAPNHDPTEYAHTEAQWLEKSGKYCAITFHPNGLNAGLALRQRAAVHELMHCAMAELSKNKAAWDHIPKFLDEGMPEWAAYTIAKEWSGSLGGDDWWDTALKKSFLPLFGREYDAVGFWSLVAHEGNNLFAQLPAYVQAGSSGNPQRVYNEVLSIGGGQAIEGDWGPTLAGQPDLGPRWDLDGPLQTKRNEPDLGTVSNGGTPKVKAALKGGADEFKVDVQAEVVSVVGPKEGDGYFRDSEGTDHSLTGDAQRFCTEETCVCPDGSELPYPSIPTGEARIGFAATGNAGGAGIKGISIEEACKKPTIDGITVLGKNDVLLTRFTSGTCRASKSGGFTAHAKSGPWTLDITIKAFSGYGKEYDLAYLSDDPKFVIDGPGGPYSNAYGPPQPPPFGGQIVFNPRGTKLGMGFIDAFNADLSADVLPVGVMVCRKPRK